MLARSLPWLLAIVVPLAACATADSGPPPPPEFSLPVKEGKLAETTHEADQHCLEFGRRALLKGVQPGSPDSLARYACQ